jgi:hypothetical protein
MNLGDPVCDLCSGDEEISLHALKDCVHAMTLWLNVVPGAIYKTLFLQ